jgi:hypothetical protein
LLEATGVDRCVPAPKVSSDFIGATTEIKKEVDELKKIAFMIVGILMVLGLVLPGCTGGGGGGGGVTLTPTTMTFDKQAGQIVVGIPGELTHATGTMANVGASLAAAMINGGGGIVIQDDVGGGNHSYNYTIKFVETGEATVDPTGTAGVTAMNNNKNLVDFFAGGFRTEAVDKYRDVVMKNDGTGKIFYDCGAATEALCHSVVTNYPNYRFFFKGTPYNEYFLGDSVIHCIDAVAQQIRAAALAANITLHAPINATIIADNLEWAFDQVPTITGQLAAINVTLVHAAIWVDPTAADAGAEMSNVLQNTVAPLDPVIIIPVLSSNAGIYYDIYRAVWVPNAMSVGINVLSQIKHPWIGNLGHDPAGNLTLPYCAYEVELDTWADGVNMTALTYPFFSAFFATMAGIWGHTEYPLYTAATFDVLYTMKAAIEANAVYNTTSGVASADTDDIIKWLENPANAQTSTTGKAKFYPKWDGTTYCGANPALTAAQVAALYPGAAYAACDWDMPPHTTHDLAYGPGKLTGIGAQWQWDAGASYWIKVGVWPIAGSGQIDQYGNWSFSYPGTQALVIPPAVIAGLP